MNKHKNNSGITIVALIITIIVILILAVVAIQAVQNDGIIGHAKNSETEYEQAQELENSTLSDYKLELEKNAPIILTDKMIGTKFEKTTFLKDEKGKIFVVPSGYIIVKDVTTANTVEVDKGVVITDSVDENGNSIGSEFVWVPVDNINAMVRTTSGTDLNGRKNYQGILYDFTSTGANEKENYGQGTSSCREPGVVTGVTPSETVDSASGKIYDALTDNLTIVGCIKDLNKDEKVDVYDFKIQLQVEYNRMVESVAKYGGFYVGRYEISLNSSGNAQSKSGERSLYSSSSENNWYGLYAKAKTYTNVDNSVVSSMIYGSQYDAMLIWMQNNGIDVTSETPIDTSTGVKSSKNKTRVTGSVSTDKLNNVYDLLGNSYEWTQEADRYGHRVFRGAVHFTSYPPSIHNNFDGVTKINGYHSSRLTLYVK